MTEQSQPPLVVIGNITVGGTGKTPIIVWLANILRSKGYTVGVIARGHGTGQVAPLEVVADSLTTEVGDEPLDAWQKLNSCRQDQTQDTYIPVFIGQKRNEARLALQASYPVDVILSDDGLQHYAMPRTFEIVLADGARGFGNGYLLPRGPLREPIGRLKSVDCVLVNGGLGSDVSSEISSYTSSIASFSLKPSVLEPLNSLAEHLLAEVEVKNNQNQFAGSDLRALFHTLHQRDRSVALVTGIGNPQRFFSLVIDSMEQQAFTIPATTHRFPDHHPFQATDFQCLALDKNAVILMTDKDAIKCRKFITALNHPAFTLSVNPQFNDTVWLDTMLDRIGLSLKKSLKSRIEMQ